MATTVLVNVGTLVTGLLGEPPISDTSLVVEDGVVVAVGDDREKADVVVDAAGLTVLPGLVDGHVHPTFGQYTPAQNAIGWMDNYLQGGTTSMVSAGELHLPGLPLDALDPGHVLALATLARATTSPSPRGAGVKPHFGTVLLTAGMTESMFDQMVERGLTQLKFIFYDWTRGVDGEAQSYVRWARERDLVVKVHSGGVSRSGVSAVAGYDVIRDVAPDIVAHISGGPIPMPDEEIVQVIDDVTDSAVEICSSMNYRATRVVVDRLVATDQLARLTLGTDTPGGTGVIPRGMLRNICFLASVCGLDPAAAVAAATGNTARHHRISGGVLAPGHPADLIICGPITGSRAADALESFALGDLPGISVVLVNGQPVVAGRSSQTPPPRRLATIRYARTAT